MIYHDNMKQELDFYTAMSIIRKVEKSDHKGDFQFLQLALGAETMETMLVLGYLHTGFYFRDGKVIDTYGVNQRYKDWNRILTFRRNMARVFPCLRVHR